MAGTLAVERLLPHQPEFVVENEHLLRRPIHRPAREEAVFLRADQARANKRLHASELSRVGLVPVSKEAVPKLLPRRAEVARQRRREAPNAITHDTEVIRDEVAMSHITAVTRNLEQRAIGFGQEPGDVSRIVQPTTSDFVSQVVPRARRVFRRHLPVIRKTAMIPHHADHFDLGKHRGEIGQGQGQQVATAQYGPNDVGRITVPFQTVQRASQKVAHQGHGELRHLKPLRRLEVAFPVNRRVNDPMNPLARRGDVVTVQAQNTRRIDLLLEVPIRQSQQRKPFVGMPCRGGLASLCCSRRGKGLNVLCDQPFEVLPKGQLLHRVNAFALAFLPRNAPLLKLDRVCRSLLNWFDLSISTVPNDRITSDFQLARNGGFIQPRGTQLKDLGNNIRSDSWSHGLLATVSDESSRHRNSSIAKKRKANLPKDTTVTHEEYPNMTDKTPPGSEWRILAHNTNDGEVIDLRSKRLAERHAKVLSHLGLPPLPPESIAPDSVFDELVIDDWLHLEQMDDDHWWMKIGNFVINVTINEDGKPPSVMIEEERP